MNELFLRRKEVLLAGVTQHWPAGLHVGTCSWKYDDWRGLLYSDAKKLNHLQEYARHLGSVEVDQWFWSLFGPDRVVLPKPNVVHNYAESVPPGFRFSVKAPNSLSLTHFYKQSPADDLVANPHFLSPDLYRRFLASLEPLGDRLGIVMLQFEYLNRRKMPSLGAFLEALAGFLDQVPRTVPLAIECRNPNYMAPEFFDFLAGAGVAPVFCQGYYMPPVTTLMDRFMERIGPHVVVRLMGPDRDAIEQASQNSWDAVIEDRSDELAAIGKRVKTLLSAGTEVTVNVNNHYEGSAPITISKLARMLSED